ncbi:MAG: hypothetical protein NVS3B24_18100 [Candidatus Dormibacteria bacterium]
MRARVGMVAWTSSAGGTSHGPSRHLARDPRHKGLSDYEAAATIYRRCRGRGEHIRALTDCLVASVAIRAEVPVIHADSAFEAIARHTGLKLEAAA